MSAVSFSGSICVRLMSADIPGLLSAIYMSGIPAYHVIQESQMRITMMIPRDSKTKLEHLLLRRGGELEVVSKNGIYWFLQSLMKRPVLLIGMALLIFLTLYIPTRVFFFAVEGNQTVSAQHILTVAENLGLNFGTSTRSIRSERIKNDLLEAIPQLQWVGVNTSGCVVTIRVTERTQSLPTENSSGVSSIIAARDGVIHSVTITKGNGLCSPGQSVTSGQVLISGYTDCGLSIRAEHAQGEVFAKTMRQLTVAMPSEEEEQRVVTSETRKISLIIGKNRINFFKGSGISGGSCDKMYEEYYLTLPGGFRLPAAVCVETVTDYDLADRNVPEDAALTHLKKFARNYLTDIMLSGTVLEVQETPVAEQDLLFLYGKYTCLEMIGRTRTEEKIYSDGEND